MVSRKIGIVLMVSMLVNLLLFGGIQPATSESFGPEIHVSTATNGDQNQPDIAMDSEGNFVVCWEDNNGGDDNVRFQRYSNPSTPQGGEIAVVATAAEEDDAAIAMNASGDFVIVWEDDSGPGGFDDVLAQRYNSSGTAQDGAITVATGGASQDNPAVAMDSSGNFVVAWQDNTGGDWDVHAQRYDSNGNPQGGVIDVDTGGDNEDNPAVAMDSSGNFVVAWEDSGGAVGDAVQARIYDSNGNPQGGAFNVANGAGDEDTAAVAIDPSGNFVVAWEDDGTGDDDVKARRYLADGTAQGAAFTVASGAGTGQDQVDVAMDANGSFLVAWEDDSGGNNEIMAQRYNSEGAALGSAFQANTYTTGDQDSPAVAMDANGSSVVTWQSFGQDTSLYGVYAQRFTNLSTTWYFAEGYTGEGFEEWLTLQNPNPVAATATITYYFRGGGTQTGNVSIAANSRQTVNVNSDVGADKEVSVKVTSTQPIIAERPMYFNYQGARQGGHNTIGATSTSATWYFAEGYTGSGFDTWLTLQNPNGAAATVTLTYYYRGGGSQLINTKTIPANSRETINVNDDAGSNQEVSIKVDSTQPIIAERPMYFNYQSKWQGGHNTIGVTSTSSTWYFSEGYTGSGFEEWLTLQNPNAASATATITYYFRGGGTQTKTMTVPAKSRETVNVNSDVGSDKEVSIKVTSTQPLIAERPMYFDYQNKWQGGHDTKGVTTPVNQWFFSEGYTGSGFDEWLTLQNPNSSTATATITYTYRGGGTPVEMIQAIPANSRETVNVNSAAGSNQEVSIKVDSTQPIIAERPMYFDYQSKWQGGHNTIGFGP